MAITAKDKERAIEPGIWKLVDGRFYGEVRPTGKIGLKKTKTAVKLSDIRDWKIKLQATAQMGEKFKPLGKDKRRLSELVNEWQNLYGYTLKHRERQQVLLATCRLIGDPIARAFTAEDFMIYRKMRLETVQKNRLKTISANTINHEHAYLSAVFSRLTQLGKWKYPNPLAGLPKLKINEPGLVYLDMDQVDRLLSALEYCRNKDLVVIAKICLSIGSRWGEASSLHGENIRNGQIQLINTKSGKARAVPIHPELEEEIFRGRSKSGRLFSTVSHKKAFDNALDRAGIRLPAGQATHVLRHTFASYFMINDGNILKLKEILGHASLEMTMRYAHLAPKHLTQALTHNPLSALNSKKNGLKVATK